MGSTNEKRRFNVTPSLIDAAQTQDNTRMSYKLDC